MGNVASQKTVASELLHGQTSIPLRRSSKKPKKETRQSFKAGIVADRHWQERVTESIG